VVTQSRFTFFVQPRDPVMETWNGRRPGVEGAVSRFGADEAFPIAELAAKLPGLLENKPRLWHSFARDRALDDLVTAALSDVRARGRRGVTAPSEIVSPHDLITTCGCATGAELRSRAARRSPPRRTTTPRTQRGRNAQYELEAELLRVFRRRGGRAGSRSSAGRQRDDPPLRREPRSARRSAWLIDAGSSTRLCVG
jgi:Xaa-Pro aminopeptidase